MDLPDKAPIAEAATPPAVPEAAPSPLRGVLLVMAAVLVFAFGDIATKHLAMRHDVSLVLFGRYAVDLLLLVAVLGPRHGRGLVRTSRTSLVLVRAVCLALASLTMALALRWMPVAQTVAIIYLARLPPCSWPCRSCGSG